MTIHTYPADDVCPHELEGFDCVCGPDVTFAEDSEPHVLHHSLDGREQHEPTTD